jgi:hypothetical protein
VRDATTKLLPEEGLCDPRFGDKKP